MRWNEDGRKVVKRNRVKKAVFLWCWSFVDLKYLARVMGLALSRAMTERGKQ